MSIVVKCIHKWSGPIKNLLNKLGNTKHENFKLFTFTHSHSDCQLLCAHAQSLFLLLVTHQPPLMITVQMLKLLAFGWLTSYCYKYFINIL